MRVACVGDSITHGVGLQANETYPAQLQRRLRADGRADAPTTDPTDGHAQTNTEPVASTKELDAVADPLAEADAAADVILFADLRAVAGTVRVAVGGPLTAPDAPAPDGRADAEADSREVSFLLHGRGRRGHEDADHVFEFLVCVRLRGWHAAASL